MLLLLTQLSNVVYDLLKYIKFKLAKDPNNIYFLDTRVQVFY